MGAQPLTVGHLDSPIHTVRTDVFIWKFIGVAERITAAVLLLLLLPVLVLVSGIIIVSSRRAPLIAHRRVGRNGRAIWVLKFRTMWNNQPAKYCVRPIVERVSCNCVPQLKSQFDGRVTSRFAAACRKYSLDEVPQLWNVVTGEMSLVGPRPLTAPEIIEYYGARGPALLNAKPGITGLWQIKGRSRLTYAQRQRLDLFMLKKWSPGLYLFVLAATIPRVITGIDAW